MKYLKLFESFKEVAKYKLYNDKLPREGYMRVYSRDQLLTLILSFEADRFTEGYHNKTDQTRSYLDYNWEDYQGKNGIFFQWCIDRYDHENDPRIYVHEDDIEDASYTQDILEFDDYFELKPEFRGHKLKKFGV